MLLSITCLDRMSSYGMVVRFLRPRIWMCLDGGRAKSLDSEICELGEYIEHRKEYKARMCERQRYAIMNVPFLKRQANHGP